MKTIQKLKDGGEDGNSYPHFPFLSPAFQDHEGGAKSDFLHMISTAGFVVLD